MIAVSRGELYFVHMNKQEEDRRVERFPRNALIYEENPVDDKNETDRLCQMLQTFTWYMYTRFNKKKTPPLPLNAKVPAIPLLVNIVLTFLSLVNNDK